MNDCLHVCIPLNRPEPDPRGGKPFRYACEKCGKLLKILSGIKSSSVLAVEEIHPDLGAEMQLTGRIADVIHERNYNCSASRAGRDCEDCMQLASEILHIVDEERSA